MASDGTRDCIGLEIPPGPPGLDVLLPPLRAALSGVGPAVALLPGSGAAQYRRRIRDAVLPGEPVPSSVAAVVPTSGSTGRPAGVLLPGDALAAAARALAEHTGTPRGGINAARGDVGAPGGNVGAPRGDTDAAREHTPVPRGRAGAARGHRWVAALPLHHVGGLMTVVRSVLAGTDPVPVASLGGAVPFSVAQLEAATEQAEHESARDGLPLAISLVPAMLPIVATGPGIELLRRYAMVLVGGAAAPTSLVEQLREAGVPVSLSYGMTESCGGAVIDGRPLPGVSVVVDATGRLVLRGAQVAAGYRDGRVPERWASSDGVRCFTTDDLGAVDADGTVRLTGRADDVVQVGGASVSLQAVAEVLRADPRVSAAEAAALPDQRWGSRIVALVVAVAPEAGHVTGATQPAAATPDAEPAPNGHPTQPAQPPTLLDTLADQVAQALGQAARPRTLRLVPRIPLLESGKPDRAELLALARAADAHGDRA